MQRVGSLVVVGTGIQWAGQTTLAAKHAIEQADRVLFAVADPWAARWIRGLAPAAESLPYPNDGRPRRRIYLEMVERILADVRKGLKVCVVFYGHPGVLTTATHDAIRRAREEGFPARMLPGISALDCLFADLGVDPGREGCQIYEATQLLLRVRSLDVHAPLVLLQIGGIGNRGVLDRSDQARIRRGLEILVEVLRRSYRAEHDVVVYEAASHPIEPPRIERVALGRLAEMSVSEISTLYVPPVGLAPVDEEMWTRLGMGAAPAAAGVHPGPEPEAL